MPQMPDCSLPLISVIVPAYNAETWIGAALESVIAQDYPNLEVIVVDDASTDATRAVAEGVLREGGRPFRIVRHGRCQGVSCARNMGLEQARGERIWFCDADDAAEKNLLSTLYGLMERYRCDIAFCGLRDHFVDDEGKPGRPDVPWPVKLPAPPIRGGEELAFLRATKRIAPGICCMLFRGAFLRETGLRFSEGCSAGEDVEFQLKAFCRAREAAFTPQCLYIYRHHTAMGSVRDNDTREKKLKRYQDQIDAQFRAARYLSEHARSERVRSLADHLLLPEAMVRRLTLFAKTGDRAAFGALLSDPSTREALSSSRQFFFRKPEVFLKAAALLCFPRVYYGLRRSPGDHRVRGEPA